MHQYMNNMHIEQAVVAQCARISKHEPDSACLLVSGYAFDWDSHSLAEQEDEYGSEGRQLLPKIVVITMQNSLMKKHIRGPAGLHNPVIDDEHQHTEDLFLS